MESARRQRADDMPFNAPHASAGFGREMHVRSAAASTGVELQTGRMSLRCTSRINHAALHPSVERDRERMLDWARRVARRAQPTLPTPLRHLASRASCGTHQVAGSRAREIASFTGDFRDA